MRHLYARSGVRDGRSAAEVGDRPVVPIPAVGGELGEDDGVARACAPTGPSPCRINSVGVVRIAVFSAGARWVESGWCKDKACSSPSAR